MPGICQPGFAALTADQRHAALKARGSAACSVTDTLPKEKAQGETGLAARRALAAELRSELRALGFRGPLAWDHGTSDDGKRFVLTATAWLDDATYRELQP